jgi:hypothetical protein
MNMLIDEMYRRVQLLSKKLNIVVQNLNSEIMQFEREWKGIQNKICFDFFFFMKIKILDSMNLRHA